MQEAYRPLHSKWGEGGTPSSHGGGYPIQSWWGVPHPVMVGGYPGYPPPSRPGPGGTPNHPDLAQGVPPTIQTQPGGTPSSHGGGYPIKSWWGVPHPVMVGGTLGTPHHPDLAQGVPPTIQTSPRGYPQPSRPNQGAPHLVMVGGTPSSHGGGVPPPSRPGPGGVPPTIQPWLGYPPPSRPDRGTPNPVEVWTDKQSENSTFAHPSDAGGKYKL